MLTGLLFSTAFCQPSRVTAGTMGPMEGANWTVGPVFAFTGYVACCCVIGHCVGVMAAHGVFLGVVFATSLPTGPPTHPSPSHPPTPPHPTHPPSPSHPTPPHLPSHPPPLLSILIAERDGKKYLEIQPSETEKVSYNKNQK